MHFPCSVALLQKVHETETQQFVEATGWVCVVGRDKTDFCEPKESHKWVFI